MSKPTGRGGVDAELAGRAQRPGVGRRLDHGVVVRRVDVEQRRGRVRVGVVVRVGGRRHAERRVDRRGAGDVQRAVDGRRAVVDVDAEVLAGVRHDAQAVDGRG